MSGVKTSAMPGAKVVASLEYWWKLEPNISPTPKLKGSSAVPQPRASAATPTPKPKATAATPRPKASPAPTQPAPKKIKSTTPSVISAINRGSITRTITENVRNANEKQSPEIHKALKDFNPTTGVRKALELMEARLEKKYLQKNCRAREGLTFGALTEQTGPITALGVAFLCAGLPEQSALVFMCLIIVADTWLWQKCYPAYDGEDEFYTWDKWLVWAVAELNCKTHGEILEGFKRDLTTVVDSQSIAYGVNLERPLSESRVAVNYILEGKKYTCPSCRETDLSRGFQPCSEACNQKLNYAGYAEMKGEFTESESSEEDLEEEGDDGEESEEVGTSELEEEGNDDEESEEAGTSELEEEGKGGEESGEVGPSKPLAEEERKAPRRKKCGC